jgi:hypothetical protein
MSTITRFTNLAAKLSKNCARLSVYQASMFNPRTLKERVVFKLPTQEDTLDYAMNYMLRKRRYMYLTADDHRLIRINSYKSAVRFKGLPLNDEPLNYHPFLLVNDCIVIDANYSKYYSGPTHGSGGQSLSSVFIGGLGEWCESLGISHSFDVIQVENDPDRTIMLGQQWG